METYEATCNVCGKVFITLVPKGTTTYAFCSDECWDNSPVFLWKEIMSKISRGNLIVTETVH